MTDYHDNQINFMTIRLNLSSSIQIFKVCLNQSLIMVDEATFFFLQFFKNILENMWGSVWSGAQVALVSHSKLKIN